VPKLRVEMEAPGEGVFITRDGEVVQQAISSLALALSNSGRTLTVGHPVQDILGGTPYEAQVSYPIGKATIIIEYEEG
jgi:hypothetical protein